MPVFACVIRLQPSDSWRARPQGGDRRFLASIHQSVVQRVPCLRPLGGVSSLPSAPSRPQFVLYA
eukprot:9116224-Lingulodinium_polyedra.AAC.1